MLYLERSMYRMFNDQDVLKEDLKQLDKYSLEILKNLVFAKHNYKFTDTFYQAYFNLFDFYSTKEKKAKRLLKVDQLFAPIDKKNLQTIQSALSKIKK
jgi:hypothetical protein